MEHHWCQEVGKDMKHTVFADIWTHLYLYGIFTVKTVGPRHNDVLLYLHCVTRV